jgi:hypothetical protein
MNNLLENLVSLSKTYTVIFEVIMNGVVVRVYLEKAL